MPVQLKLGFSSNVAPFRLRLELEGLVISGEVFSITPAAAVTHLASEGLTSSVYGDRIRFPVTQLTQATKLSDTVLVEVDAKLSALWHILAFPPQEDTPVELSLDGNSQLVLSWSNNNTFYYEDLHPLAAPALLNLEIPFVARADAFEYLRSSCNLPILIGKAQMNPDGFIEIHSNRPQLASGAPIRGMFKISSTVFGVPAQFANDIDNAPGVVWSEKPGSQEPVKLSPVLAPVTEQTQNDIAQFARRVRDSRACALVWESGLGRRFFALAAAYAVGRIPAVVLTQPAYVWLWQRHAQLVGLYSGTSSTSDVRILTYEQARNNVGFHAQTLILDDPESGITKNDPLLGILRNASKTMLRISISTQWPENTKQQVKILEAIRPEEFTAAVPIDARYVSPPAEKFAEHVSCYLFAKDTQVSPETSFKESNVVTVTPSERTQERMQAIHRSNEPAPVKLTSLLEIVSRGTANEVGPKVARALEIAEKDAARGFRVAICTRFDSTAAMVSLLGTSIGLTVCDTRGSGDLEDPPDNAVVIFDRTVPYVTMYDSVIFIDYPWSTALVDQAVGSAGLGSGVRNVTMIHMVGSVDDKLAVFAAQKRNERSSSAHGSPPTGRQAELLASSPRG